MNLNAYDNIDESIVNKTWIEPSNEKLYSREIKFYPYYTILKRFNAKLNKDEYYLALSNETDDGHDWRSTGAYRNGIRISLVEVWHKTPLEYMTNTTYIIIDKVQEDNDSVVYRLYI
jgi:hypothetical protein